MLAERSCLPPRILVNEGVMDAFGHVSVRDLTTPTNI